MRNIFLLNFYHAGAFSTGTCRSGRAITHVFGIGDFGQNFAYLGDCCIYMPFKVPQNWLFFTFQVGRTPHSVLAEALSMISHRCSRPRWTSKKADYMWHVSVEVDVNELQQCVTRIVLHYRIILFSLHTKPLREHL